MLISACVYLGRRLQVGKGVLADQSMSAGGFEELTCSLDFPSNGCWAVVGKKMLLVLISQPWRDA